MKRLLPLFAFAMAACSTQHRATNRDTIGEHFKPGFRMPSWPSAEQRDLRHSLATVKKADITVEYTAGLKMDINVGPLISDGCVVARDPRLFEPEELIPYFNGQKRKKLVVVMFHKNTWGDAKEKQQIDKINAYFRDRGYERIVIQQFRSWGQPTLSDIRP